MEHAAKLIVSALPPLATPEDPARALDILPRELDSRDESAQPLVDAVWDHLAGACVIPDGEGKLCLPDSISLHPIEDEEAVRQWCQVADSELRAGFVHPTCYRGQRLNRLKILLRRHKKNDEDVVKLTAWLETVASTDLSRTRAVFHLLKRIFDSTRDHNVRLGGLRPLCRRRARRSGNQRERNA